ncbi:hypothetical protein GIW05_00725 [Pseudomonas syringae]|uniref:hypothetical protein n=1 Tax=Pseudomonas syringae TaxID=317 RepID=UPI001F36E50B|nr:hypothetical protein [Pseudomonas syringae]MCF5382045.1 hypothetical protein [Pseudomonas syringae]MCF5419421.1 hypothetical protein [Pseudomonas syringae]MCF5451968.1 hypothetical protein [Pseudomonas syringae]MCF5458752.1 hypothetical protein [Pseudomonas syringae]
MKFAFNINARVVITLIVAGVALPATASQEEPTGHGFGVAQPMSLAPVTVCPPGSSTIIAGKSWSCADGQAPISPEKYVQLFCPGASLTTLNLTGGGTNLTVAMGFNMPRFGCRQ